MDEKQEIRWQQRFANFQKALSQLKDVVELKNPNRFEEQGLIKAFEFTYELAWNTLKDFLKYQGFSDMVGSRDTIRTAYRESLLSDGHVWMRMIESRNRTSHTYNEETARDIVKEVRSEFYPAFCELDKTLGQRLNKND